jgi:endoglucanase
VGATQYRVLVSVNGGPFTIANSALSVGTTAIVTGLTLNTPLRFEVVAVDALGNQSAPSAPITVMTTAGP